MIVKCKMLTRPQQACLLTWPTQICQAQVHQCRIIPALLCKSAQRFSSLQAGNSHMPLTWQAYIVSHLPAQASLRTRSLLATSLQ